MNTVIQSLIYQLNEIKSGKPWIGTNYDRMLSFVSDDNAFIRPTPQLLSVAELISHVTAWQKETIVKIETGKGHLTTDDEANFFSNEVLKAQTWPKVLSEFEVSLARLIELLNSKSDDFLNETYYDGDFKGDYPYTFCIYGMLHHCIYHLGQIGIVVKHLKLKLDSKQ